MSSSDTSTNFPPERDSDQTFPIVRRARFQRLTIYEVEESELLILEKGGLGSIHINLSIALLSLAVGLTATLITADFPSDRAWLLFVTLTVVSYIVGATLLLIWWRNHQSISDCVGEIRRRLPAEGIVEED